MLQYIIKMTYIDAQQIDACVAVATRTSVAALVAVDPTVDYSRNALKYVEIFVNLNEII